MSNRHIPKEVHGDHVHTWCNKTYPKHGSELETPDDKISPVELCEKCVAEKEKADA